MSAHKILISRDEAELLVEFLAWNLHFKVKVGFDAEYGEPLLHQLCDAFGMASTPDVIQQLAVSFEKHRLPDPPQ